MRAYYKNIETGEIFMSRSVSEKRYKANKEFIKSKRIQTPTLRVEVNVYNFITNTPVEGIFIEYEFFMESRYEIINGSYKHSYNPLNNIKSLGLLPQHEDYIKLEKIFNIPNRRFDLSEMKDMINELLKYYPNLSETLSNYSYGIYVFPDGLIYTLLKYDNIIEVFPNKIIDFENNKTKNVLKFEI